MASCCDSIGDIRFSSAHGRNIQLLNDGTTASWKLCRHNGYCFTTRPLRSHEKVTIQAQGSGHFLFGLVHSKPDLDLISNEDATSVLPSAHWEHFRLFKKDITIGIYRDKSEVTMRQGTETIVIQDNANLFVLLELKFGYLDVDVESDSFDNTIVFDKRCGPNVGLLSQNRRVCLKQFNPHAICVVNRNIYPGETIHCSVSPNEDASWTQVEFFLSNCSPENLQLQCIDQNLSWNKDRQFKLVPLGVVLEDEGTVQLCITEDGEILSNHNMKTRKENFQELDVLRPIFLYIDLFRMQTTIWRTSSNSTNESYVKAHRITPIKGHCDSNRQSFEAPFLESDTDVEFGYLCLPLYSLSTDRYQATSASPDGQDTTDLKQLQNLATEKKEVVTQVDIDESATCDDQTMRKGLHDVFRNVPLPIKIHKSNTGGTAIRSTGQDDSSLTDSEEEYIAPLHKPCEKYSPTCAKPNVTQANHYQPDVANVEPDHSFTRPNAIMSDSPLTHTKRVPPVPKPRLLPLQYVQNKDQIENRRDVTSKPISPGSHVFPLSTFVGIKGLGVLQPAEQAPPVPPRRGRETSSPLPSPIDEEGASGNVPCLLCKNIRNNHASNS